MSIPAPPIDAAELDDFPLLIWRAHQPLARVHRQEFGSLYFGTDQDGRWNPPQPGSGWGTCYMSTHPVGAALEVFGRLSFLPQREIEDRVLATIYMESDLRLADMTHPSVIGRFGLTAEVSTGEETTTYSRTQKSIDRDFGKATGGEGPTGPWSEWLEESTAATTPIPHDVIDELRDTYGFTIIGGGYSL